MVEFDQFKNEAGHNYFTMSRYLEWRQSSGEIAIPKKRKYEVAQLVCLSNLEILNAYLIERGVNQQERLIELNKTAIRQMKVLTEETLQVSDGSDLEQS